MYCITPFCSVGWSELPVPDVAADKDPSAARPVRRLHVLPALKVYFFKELSIIQRFQSKAFEKVKGQILKDSSSDALDLLGQPRLAEGAVKMRVGSIAGTGLKSIG